MNKVKNKSESAKYANRLIHETSPYLLQHAHNPVDWYPWGSEALEKARREDRPVFLSIGYTACHWCHVLNHESFENPEVAAIMNEHFVSIKVDREERPDLDDIYMNAVVALTGQGGWPMSVFLTPDGVPFYGGTYWPPTPRGGMPGFVNVLLGVADAWENRREDVLRGGASVLQHIRPIDLP
ncbi:MAG: thioredoxin domain-containing protein, partial [Chloroflexi bacterium]|nr:thioredoxin domain-containing protein [Chloroflexota bacterium]